VNVHVDQARHHVATRCVQGDCVNTVALLHQVRERSAALDSHDLTVFNEQVSLITDLGVRID
jgi:hypothetical protein